jgi:cell wall-associated NlpC family hydrolase
MPSAPQVSATPMSTGAASSTMPQQPQSNALAQSIIDSNAKQFHLPRIQLPVMPQQLGISVQPDGVAPAQMPHPTQMGQAIVAAAKNFLGVKYTWGGTSPKTGFDCSGLVKYVMN